MGEWIHKLWYIHTVEYYPAPQKETSYETMKIHGGHFNACYYMKEANLTV